MRRKRNRDNPVRNTDGYIKKYFGSDISKILVPSIKNIQNVPTPYVEHREAENVLRGFLSGDTEKDKSMVFTGLTGSGKTTILRHVFEIEDNSNCVKIVNKTITIPVDFNRSQVDAQTAILSSMRSAVEYLCKQYQINQPTLDNEDFYKFVKRLRNDFANIEVKRNENIPQQQVLKSFYDSAAVPFTSCQLQYVLNSEKCDIELVILIIDNVEGFGGEGKNRLKYLQPVIEALRLYDCIGQRQQPTKWCFNMIIACRHYIVRLLKGEEDENGSESTLLESFVTSESTYDLRNPVEINQIVEKREAVFSRNQKTERWRMSVFVLQTVLKKMEGTLGDFIVQMELKDLRKSMAAMQDLILNSGLQRKTEEEIKTSGAFQIGSASQFDLSRINLIRTFAIGNQTYYSDKSRVPNLMFNEREEGLELYPLLTVKYFLERCGYEEPSWENSVSIDSFYQTMKELFALNELRIKWLFKSSVYYFIKHRVLLRSADQHQDEVPGLTTKEIRQIEYVYVSGATVRLWNELKESSALFQLYMDDIYFEDNSDYLQQNGNDIEHCFEYLKYLWTKEKRIFNTVKNQSDIKVRGYIQCFGSEPICKHLAKGLLNSLDYIACHDLTAKGRKAKKTYKEVKQFIDDIPLWA